MSSSPEAVRRVVVATANRGKVAEIRAALVLPGWAFVTAEELGSPSPEVEETGATFYENALLKAEAYSDAFGMPALADDSGLEVDVLGGEPGVLSARYAGEGATDADNNAKLLSALGGVPPERRAARFRSVVVLAEPGGVVAMAEGVCEGRIGSEPRGAGGFGYDPLFLPDAVPGKTMAELGMAEKNAISHRGRALAALRAELERGGPRCGR